MPELPEVETLIRSLRKPLTGRRITSVHLEWPNMLVRPTLPEFCSSIVGRRVTSLDRRGKYLVFHLDGDSNRPTTLILHLKMSGNLLVQSASSERAKHDRVVFGLDNGTDLRFNDPRKFGRVFLVARPEEVLAKLGPEPLSDSLTEQGFLDRLASRPGAIKPLLLDQTFLAGIGNIYADESLWRARIHPLTKAARLSAAEGIRLRSAIRQTLELGIRHAGTDAGDGVVPDGNYRPRVYAREGRPCYRCGSAISKIIVGQRGTHLCPECQRARK